MYCFSSCNVFENMPSYCNHELVVMIVSPVVLIPPFWALDVTVLTLVTFLEWNDLNKVKDDGKKHRTGRWEGAVVMK